MQEPKVSVVMTCYNYGRFLAASLESALGQTYRNVEIIVVDDGSTDETPEVMSRYAGNPRVRSIRQQNRGQAAAKNAGVRNSDGPLVAFLDADDLWEPDKLAKQVPAFERPAVGVVYSNLSLIGEDGRPLPFKGFTGYLRPRSGRITSDLVFDNPVTFSSSVVRREILDRVGGFDESLQMGIDWDLWLKISLDWEFAVVDEPLVRYRIGHAGQMSHRTEERFRSSDFILSRFLEQHPDAVTAGVRRRERAYACVIRAGYYRDREWLRSTRLLMKALVHDWTFLPAYEGLLRNVLAPVIRRGK